MKKICVIGSANMDMVIKSARLPLPGETVIGSNFFMNAGGKGANQAVAAARLHASVLFVTSLGQDLFGKQMLQLFKKEKINTRFISTTSKHPTGVALINLDDNGENCITVAPGANSDLGLQIIDEVLSSLKEETIILLQLEIPMPAVIHTIFESTHRNHKVILNPAPAQILEDHIYPHLFLITPNETEAEALTEIKVKDEISAQNAAKKLLQKGVQNVVITMGSKGAFLCNEDENILIPAPSVESVLDTTAAGDCFNGALAAGIAEGIKLSEAVAFACKAASISVTKMGAQSSLPTRNEITNKS